jgi:membrane-bound serine protease (ClpP class)
VLANPELAYILLTLGTLGLIFELQNPHGVTGVLGAIFLVLALISFSIIPFSVGGLALMALGVGLFVAEIKLQTHGGLAIAGAICLLLGSLMLFAPIEPFWHVSRILIVSMALLFSSVFVLLTIIGLGALRRPPSVGREMLAGAHGVALTNLAPAGQVHVQGEIWSAVLVDGAAPVHKGGKIIVKSVQGLTLEVKPAPGAPARPAA